MCEHSTDSGGNSKGDPPVPIPNTVVKPLRADGTWMDTSRESRSLPDTTPRVYISRPFFYAFLPANWHLNGEEAIKKKGIYEV